MRTIVVVLIVLILLACWFAYQVLKLLRSSLHGPITQEIPEIAHFGEVVEYHPGDTGPPHVPDSIWEGIVGTFEMWDERLADIKRDDIVGNAFFAYDIEQAAGAEPFVPEVRHFGSIEGREMEFCHGVGQLVVHRKTCPRAPHEERRRYIWAFGAAELGEWTDAEPGEWRYCRVCKPGEPAGGASQRAEPGAAAPGGEGAPGAAGAQGGQPDAAGDGAGGADTATEEAPDAVRVASS